MRYIVENEYLNATTIDLDPGIRVTAESVGTCVLVGEAPLCDAVKRSRPEVPVNVRPHRSLRAWNSCLVTALTD